MADRPIVIVGAGASFHTKAPGLTNLLPTAIAAEPAKLVALETFLRTYFGCIDPRRRSPALPFVLGIVDTALERNQDLGPAWGLDELRTVRSQIEYGIFSVLKELTDEPDLYQRLVVWLADASVEPTIVSLNYDTLTDTAMILHANHTLDGDGPWFPDYGCQIATQPYAAASKYGELYKLVGSLHWMHCPSCQRLDALFYADMMPSEAAAAADARLRRDDRPGNERRCTRHACGAAMRPVIVSPTPIEGEPGPHIANARYAAERALLQADAAIFIGYAMNPSDLAISYLLKRGLAELPPDRITVVAGSYADVRERYNDAFGPSIVWTGKTFDEWLDSVPPVSEQ